MQLLKRLSRPGSSLVKIYSQSRDTIIAEKKHDSDPQPGSGSGCG